MSHSAQFHKNIIPSCPKSSWKVNRDITIQLGRRAISVLWPVSTTPKTYDTTLLSRPNYACGFVQHLFLIFSLYHTTRNTRIWSQILSTDLCSSDAKLIYRKEQQPFWNVRGVQSRHGTLADCGRSCLSLHFKRGAIVEKLYAVSIFTL
jgi:hypothetical protein